MASFWALNFLTALEANVSDVRFVPIADIASEMKLEGPLVVTNLSVGSDQREEAWVSRTPGMVTGRAGSFVETGSKL